MEIFDLNKLFLLNETLVEKLLNIFTDDFKLGKQFKDLKDLKTYIINLAAKDNIKLNFDENKPNLESVGGHFYPSPHEIIIDLPRNVEFTAYDIFNVFFHEYAHYINETRVKESGKINPIRVTKEEQNSYIIPPDVSFKFAYLYKNISKIYQLLEHTIQPQERSNWAFSIAYDIYDAKPVILKKTINNFNKPDRDLIDKLIRSHEYAWEEKQTEYQIQEYSNSLGSTGAQMFFFLIGAYKALMKIEDKDFKKDQELIKYRYEKLIDLIRKYYRRLVGVMLYAKQNKNKLQIFRIGDRSDRSKDSKFPIGKY